MRQDIKEGKLFLIKRDHFFLKKLSESIGKPKDLWNGIKIPRIA